MLTVNERQSGQALSTTVSRFFSFGLAMMVSVGALAVTPNESPRPPQQVETADEVVLNHLSGLVFVGSVSDVLDEGLGASGVVVKGVELLDTPDFRALMAGYLQRPLTMTGLQSILDRTVVYARERGYPVVDVLVPEQDVTAGAVQIVFLEGRLGSIGVNGLRWFREKTFVDNMRLQPGQPVSAVTLEQDIAWLNRNPFRQVDAVFVQGSEPGTTDIRLQVQERYPVRVYATYENSGNSVIGKDLWGVGVNWGNVFDTDHQAGYQYNRSGKDGVLQVHGMDYTIPLSWRHVLSFSASYASVDSELFELFGLRGRSERFSGRYWFPLDAVVSGLGQNLQLGFDYKRSNNNLEFFGTQVFDDTVDVVQLVLEYSASMADSWGLNSWYVNVYNSPGKLTSDNRDEYFEAVRPGALAHYNYAKIGYDRLQRLPANLTWAISASAQRADGRLLSSEQIGIGGRTSVRGYEERHLSGDHGFLVTNELRSRSYALPNSTPTTPSEVQGILFLDWGKSQIANPLPGEYKARELSTAGLGLRYQWGNFLTLQSDYGWQMTGRSSDTDDSGRLHVRIMLSY